jgi:general L-amino acid transport system permease protein
MTSLWTVGTFVAVAIVGWAILPDAPLSPEYPLPKGFNIKGGLRWTPEFCAVVFALVIYTASFVAEIVRGGIMSVTKGQIEAARSLGLSGIDTMRIVIMPQALRVIIPPLTSTWMSLTKNSSLALAVGYPDVVAIAGTVQMQSGRAVEVWFMMVMPVYLTLSLLTSAFGNWYNKRKEIVER